MRVSHPAPPHGKRVAFLVSHLHKGGMQRAISNLSCALPPDVAQYVAYFGTEQPPFPYRACMVDLACPGRRGSRPWHKAANFVRRARRLQQFIDQEQITTVVSFGEAANVLNVLTRRKRTVLSVRVAIDESLRELGMYGQVYRRLARRLYCRADCVVAVSHDMLPELEGQWRIPSTKLRAIPNVYDVEEIRRLSSLPSPLARRGPTIVNVGSLCPQKGQQHLIRAFAAACRAVANLQLVIVGGGPLEPNLKNLARCLGVHEQVHLVGHQENPYTFLAQADVFALTSLYEGFPNALAEALICGVPSVSFDCPTGPREILGDSQYGMLLPAINQQNAPSVEMMASQAIVSLLEPQRNEEYRRRAHVRARHFDRTRVVDQWMTVL